MTQLGGPHTTIGTFPVSSENIRVFAGGFWNRLFILTCFQDEIIYPVESGYACYFFRGLFQRVEGIDEDTLHCVQALEDLVWEPLFTDLLPDVLYRIEFRAIGRQENDPHILGNLEIFGSMPSGFVHYHEDEMVGMTLRHFREKQRHGVSINYRKNQRIQNAVSR